jgi:5-methylcytosine-specific restriction protein A
MVAGQLKSDGLPENLKEYNNLGPKERETITLARIGPGPFRQVVLDYWKTCAVTGCSEQKLLEAAHIKPWKAGTAPECYSVYNGLLLTPTLHRCLDGGYIAFSETGGIMISPRLSLGDRKALGIHTNLKLRKLEAGQRPFLDYHRAWYENLHADV